MNVMSWMIGIWNVNNEELIVYAIFKFVTRMITCYPCFRDKLVGADKTIDDKTNKSEMEALEEMGTQKKPPLELGKKNTLTSPNVQTLIDNTISGPNNEITGGEKEKQQQQESSSNEKKPDENKSDEKKEQDKKEQEKKDQQNKDQKQEEKDQDQEQKDEEQKKKEQQEKEQKEQNKDEQKQENKEVPPEVLERLKQMKISEEKARMILEAMKNQEVQYLQQNKRKATKPKDRGKPDW